jgi:WD40 repeat protein
MSRAGSDVLSVSLSEDGSTARGLIWNTRERVVLRELTFSRTSSGSKSTPSGSVLQGASEPWQLGVPPLCGHSIAWDRHVIAQNTAPSRSIIKYCTLEREFESAKLALPENITALVCSHQGLWLAVGTQNGLGYLWDLGSGALVVPRPEVDPASKPNQPPSSQRDALAWQVQPLAVTALQFTADDQFIVAGGEDGSVSVWALHELFRGHTSRPWRRYVDVHAGCIIAFRLGASWQVPFTRVYSIGRDRTLRIHDLGTGKLLVTIHLSAPPTCLAVDDIFERVVYVGLETGEVLGIFLPSLAVDASRVLIANRASRRSSGGDAACTSWICAYTDRDMPGKRAVRALSFAEAGSLLLYGNESGAVGLIHLPNHTTMAEFRGPKAHGKDAVFFVMSISPPTGAVPALFWQPTAYAQEKRRQWNLTFAGSSKQNPMRLEMTPSEDWHFLEFSDDMGVRLDVALKDRQGPANAEQERRDIARMMERYPSYAVGCVTALPSPFDVDHVDDDILI